MLAIKGSWFGITGRQLYSTLRPNQLPVVAIQHEEESLQERHAAPLSPCHVGELVNQGLKCLFNLLLGMFTPCLSM